MKRASPEDAYDARLQAKELIENFKAGFLTTMQSVGMHSRGEIDVRQVAYMFRMTMCWVVISLSKLVEFWERYGALASPNLTVEMREIIRVIRERDVRGFRDAIAAHMFDLGTRNPVPQDEVQERLVRIWGGTDPQPFLLWLHDPREKSHATVCAVLRRFRVHLKENFEIVEPDHVRNAPKLYLPPDQDD